MKHNHFLILSLLLLLAMPMVVTAQTNSLQDLAASLKPLPKTTIYVARQIVTGDPRRPTAEAVAVVGKRILAVGSKNTLLHAVGDQPWTLDETFKDQVMVPGLIAQHDHPFLSSLCMTAEIIAIEDWVLPSGTVPAAKDRADYLARLAATEAKMDDPDALLLTWGFHHYFHGKLAQADLDKISSSRPIIVWHRSCHEFYLNSAAMKKYGVTKEWYAQQSKSVREQSDFDEGHFWEQGLFALLPLVAKDIASPDRLRAGLEFTKNYFHANGVTLGCEPGGVLSKPLQEAQNAVLGDNASPFRYYYIPDGKSLVIAHPEDQVIAETEKLMSWGKGMTAFVPKQVKLFADGAIYSQAMQVTDGYLDGHKGEWMMDLDLFAKAFRIYWDAGYQIHIHVNGDAGLGMVLDTLEENMRRNPRHDHRTVIVHFAVSTREQVDRIASLGAIVSANPYYVSALADNYSENGLGPQRANQMVRLGDVQRAGISYSLHSDMPMAPAQPLFLMHCAVNRTTMSGRIAGANQKASRETAFAAITREAAYSLQMENEVGSIEPGKLANFTILEENPLEVDADKIKDIQVWGTVLEGRVQPIPTTDEVSFLLPKTSRDMKLARLRRLNAQYHRKTQRGDNADGLSMTATLDSGSHVERTASSGPSCVCGSRFLHALASSLTNETNK